MIITWVQVRAISQVRVPAVPAIRVPASQESQVRVRAIRVPAIRVPAISPSQVPVRAIRVPAIRVPARELSKSSMIYFDFYIRNTGLRLVQKLKNMERGERKISVVRWKAVVFVGGDRGWANPAYLLHLPVCSATSGTIMIPRLKNMKRKASLVRWKAVLFRGDIRRANPAYLLQMAV